MDGYVNRAGHRGRDHYCGHDLVYFSPLNQCLRDYSGDESAMHKCLWLMGENSPMGKVIFHGWCEPDADTAQPIGIVLGNRIRPPKKTLTLRQRLSVPRRAERVRESLSRRPSDHANITATTTQAVTRLISSFYLE